MTRQQPNFIEYVRQQYTITLITAGSRDITGFAQEVGPGTKHANPNCSYSTREQRGSAGQNQSSCGTAKQRTANTLTNTRTL